MQTTPYERQLFGNFANDDKRPPAPNVIELAIRAIGRDNYRHDWRGHWVWHFGRWNGPLKLDGLMRAANEKLLSQGKPQITVNPLWGVS
jgi:hypothetical protein